MKLDNFLKEKDKKNFLKEIKIHRATLWHMLKGKIPNKKNMAKIFIATKGQVQPNDFFNLEELKKQFKR